MKKLFAIIGGSIGGGLVWEIAALSPELSENYIPIASDWKSSDWLLANTRLQKQILNNLTRKLFIKLLVISEYKTLELILRKF